MDLDSALVDLKSGVQEFHNLGALVALELQDISEFFVFVDVAVATEIFLQSLKNSLKIILCRKSLNSSQGLATITLLATDVDVVCRF